MNDALTALNSHAGVLLLVLNLGVVLLLARLCVQASAQRRERQTHTGQLADQLSRVLAGLQKINSSIIAQTHETKERLGSLKPALEQAEQVMREGTSFTGDFKAVRGELRQLDERLATLNLATVEIASAHSAVTGTLGELKQEVGTLREESAAARMQPAPDPLPPPELRQLQEQVGALRQVMTSAAQAQATGTTELRTGLNTLAAEQSRAAQTLRDSLATELRQQEARFRELSEKFLAESAQLRTRIESEGRPPPSPLARQVKPDNGDSPKGELDAETRKEFRKLADRLDGLQRRMEEIIKL